MKQKHHTQPGGPESNRPNANRPFNPFYPYVWHCGNAGCVKYSLAATEHSARMLSGTFQRWRMVGMLPDMADKKSKVPDTDNARIAKPIMAKVRVIAARRNVSTTKYLNEVLTRLVESDYAAAVAEMAKETRRR